MGFVLGCLVATGCLRLPLRLIRRSRPAPSPSENPRPALTDFRHRIGSPPRHRGNSFLAKILHRMVGAETRPCIPLLSGRPSRFLCVGTRIFFLSRLVPYARCGLIPHTDSGSRMTVHLLLRPSCRNAPPARVPSHRTSTAKPMAAIASPARDHFRSHPALFNSCGLQPEALGGLRASLRHHSGVRHASHRRKASAQRTPSRACPSATEERTLPEGPMLLMT